MADKKNKMDVEVSIKADKQDITQLEKQLQQAVSIDGLSKVSREIIQFIDLLMISFMLFPSLFSDIVLL